MVCAPVRRDNPRAYLTCTTITSVDLAHTEYLELKIGYLWIVVQVSLTNYFFSV